MGPVTPRAGPESLGQRGPVEVLADEDQGVHARLGAPFAVELGVEEHVDPLEDEALGRSLDAEDALHPVDVAPLVRSSR
jgi:hypothetical protein